MLFAFPASTFAVSSPGAGPQGQSLATLAIIQTDARVAARIGTALGGMHDLMVRSSWRALRELLRREDVDGCIVDVDHPNREGARAEIRALRARHISLAIVAYVDASAQPDFYDLGGLGVGPTTLARGLRRTGLPPPSQFLVWGRLLVAGAFLARDGRTVEEAAFALGYSSASALARAMKRKTGLTPGEVAVAGGMASVQRELLARSKKSGRIARRAGNVILAAAALSLAGCAGFPGGGTGVDREAIEAVLDAPPLDQVHFGVYAVDARTGRVLFARNAHRKFVPASNQKVLVTATAMSLLGPDFRYETEVWATGSRMGSMLDGDLVMLASGDPTFSDRFWDSGTAALDAIADTLYRRGVHDVTGSMFVDVSAWDSATVGPTWEVEDLRFAYGSTGGAFAIDEGEIELIVSAGPAVG